eukprot:620203-Rhodomonas_salina.4
MSCLTLTRGAVSADGGRVEALRGGCCKQQQGTPRNPIQETAAPTQFVPKLRFLVFDFAVYLPRILRRSQFAFSEFPYRAENIQRRERATVVYRDVVESGRQSLRPGATQRREIQKYAAPAVAALAVSGGGGGVGDFGAVAVMSELFSKTNQIQCAACDGVPVVSSHAGILLQVRPSATCLHDPRQADMHRLDLHAGESGLFGCDRTARAHERQSLA